VLDIICLPVSPFMQNCNILVCSETKEAAVVDAGDEADRIIATLEANHLIPKMLVNTHCHVDHASGVAELQERLGLPFYAHPDEAMILAGLLDSQGYFGFGDGKTPTPEYILKEGVKLPLGNLTLEVIETPGHTPGGVCLLCGDHLFTGDTLFAGSIGRTDLPGGDSAVLMHSLEHTVMGFDDHLIVHPGHGPNTEIGREKQSNPFLQGFAGAR